MLSTLDQNLLFSPQRLRQIMDSDLAKLHAFVNQTRVEIQTILQGKDPRLLVMVGPCSIHDEHAALEYASHLKEAAARFKNELLLVMRCYFEKPRTSIGWRGLINDPLLDGSGKIAEGLMIARRLLTQLAANEIPAATEFLEVLVPPYLSDLVSWSVIGARTSESQIHREMASGLAMPVGFKNTTDGNVKVAIDAVQVASLAHRYISISADGLPCVANTVGNSYCHVILRGSQVATNYEADDVAHAALLLQEKRLISRVLIDCSHGNSQKQYHRQGAVVQSVCKQIAAGGRDVVGVMLESNLVSGAQEIGCKDKLVYGQSVTDPCLSWDETVPLLERLAGVNRG